MLSKQRFQPCAFLQSTASIPSPTPGTLESRVGQLIDPSTVRMLRLLLKKENFIMSCRMKCPPLNLMKVITVVFFGNSDDENGFEGF